ncbi:MAG: SDR family oxidoreductase [Segniliparus sp.]|uniref:SDR family oxidoreductase n=1 Tax=Segniliparus sp. TaxID=2804064 RepID=UPI003F3F9C97
MQIEGRVALVTGANRGIGKAFARELRRLGATKVYAAARDVASIVDDDVVPIRLDVTDPASVAEAAELAGDVSILVNNAGLLLPTPPLAASLDDAREQFEVNCLGTWAATQAFAPVIARNGGGAVVNMLSVASWASGRTDFAGYAASKAAQWAVTNALRRALRPQGVQMVGVHVGFVDTDMTAGVDGAKNSPEDVARTALRGLADDLDEVLVDQRTREVKASLSTGDPAYLAPLP